MSDKPVRFEPILPTNYCDCIVNTNRWHVAQVQSQNSIWSNNIPELQNINIGELLKIKTNVEDTPTTSTPSVSPKAKVAETTIETPSTEEISSGEEKSSEEDIKARESQIISKALKTLGGKRTIQEIQDRDETIYSLIETYASNAKWEEEYTDENGDTIRIGKTQGGNIIIERESKNGDGIPSLERVLRNDKGELRTYEVKNGTSKGITVSGEDADGNVYGGTTIMKNTDTGNTIFVTLSPDENGSRVIQTYTPDGKTSNAYKESVNVYEDGIAGYTYSGKINDSGEFVSSTENPDSYWERIGDTVYHYNANQELVAQETVPSQQKIEHEGEINDTRTESNTRSSSTQHETFPQTETIQIENIEYPENEIQEEELTTNPEIFGFGSITNSTNKITWNQ